MFSYIKCFFARKNTQNHTVVVNIPATLHLYEGIVVNRRMRINVKAEYSGNMPIGKYVTG